VSGPGLDALAAALERERSRGGLAGWRLSLLSWEQVGLVVQEGQAASPHAPAVAGDGLQVSALVAWDEEGRVSRARFGAAELADPADAIAAARRAAHVDPDAAALPEPVPPPALALRDRSVEQLVGGEPDLLAEVVAAAEGAAAQAGVRLHRGRVSATTSATRVVSSTGFDGSYEETLAGYGFTFDGRWGDGRTRRHPPDLDEVHTRLGAAATLARELGARSRGVEPAELPVLLHPSAASGVLSAFLLGNLSGAGVVHGRSAFTLDQFDRRDRVLREGFRLGVDPLRDGAVGALPFTTEGVVSRRVTLIEDGRLETPILSLKYARRTGRPPTPGPAAGDALVAEDPLALDLEEARRWLTPGLAVYSLLGLHTQDPASGAFSVVAEQALYHDEEHRTPLAAVIADRLLEGLAGDKVRLVRWPGYDWPGLLLAACSVLPRP
jgi:PmbA protein